MIATPSRQIDSYARNKERRCTESLAHDAWTCVESAPQRSVVEGGIGRLGENRRIQTRVSGRGKRQSSDGNSGCIVVSNKTKSPDQIDLYVVQLKGGRAG
jgi:hypothetical protein